MRFLPLIISIHFTIVLSLQECPCRGLGLSSDHQSAFCQCYMCLGGKSGVVMEEVVDDSNGYKQQNFYAENEECRDLYNTIQYAFEPLHSVGRSKYELFGKWIKHKSHDGTTEWQSMSSSKKWQPPKPRIAIYDGMPDHWTKKEPRKRSAVQIWGNGVNPCTDPKAPHYAVCTYDLSISTLNLFEPNYL